MRDWDEHEHPRHLRGHPAGFGGRFRERWAGAVSRALQRGFTDEDLTAREARAASLTADHPMSTWALHRHDGRWDDTRAAIHQQIVEQVWRERDYDRTPTDRQGILAGGLAGAGKSTTLSRQVDLSQYVTINPDEMKEEIIRRGLHPTVPGFEDLSPMEHSTLVHMESVHLANMLAERALARGSNVLIDASMGTREATAGRVARLREAGYRVAGVFVDVPVETSLARSSARYRQGMRDWLAGKGLGGRPIPPAFILGQRGTGDRTINRQVFEDLRSAFDSAQVFDNTGDIPRLAES